MDRNVVLLCLDTVRKDYFDRYAPRLNERSSVVFEQCRATSSWSVPSHASMMTGELPHEHGVHTHDRDFSRLDRADTFLDELSGYETMGVSANSFANEDFGFDGLFDEFCSVSRVHRYPDVPDPREFDGDDQSALESYLSFLRASLGHDRSVRCLANGVCGFVKKSTHETPFPDPLDDTTKPVIRETKRLAAEADDPYFLFVNTMEAHNPFHHILGYDRDIHGVSSSWSSTDVEMWDVVDRPNDHQAYLDAYRGLYAAAVDYLDRTMTALVTELQEMSDRETVVLVTSDHGENLGYEADDHLLNHTSSLSEGLLHVPLTVIPPREADAGDYPSSHDQERVREYVSHLRLGDLVTSLADGTVPDVTSERVAAETVGMSPVPEPPDDREHWDRMLRCVYDGCSKTVWDSLGGRERYELDPDRPNWQRPLDGTAPAPERGAEFFGGDVAEYKRDAVRSEGDVKVDATTQRRLEDLGYR